MIEELRERVGEGGKRKEKREKKEREEVVTMLALKMDYGP